MSNLERGGKIHCHGFDTYIHTNTHTDYTVIVITPVEEIMFLSVFVCLFVCLFVCSSAGLCKNYRLNYHKTWWKDVV